MSRLFLQNQELGNLDYELQVSPPLENLFEPEPALNSFNRYTFLLKNSPAKFWAYADLRKPIKIWDDGVWMRSGENFIKDWRQLPAYVMYELLKALQARALIAQPQATHDSDSINWEYEGNPEMVDVKIVIFVDYKIDNPLRFLFSFFRSKWKSQGTLACSLQAVLADEELYAEQPKEVDLEEVFPWAHYKEIENLAKHAQHPEEEED